MCGIVGIIPKKDFDYKSDKCSKLANNLLFIDTLRGEDGTGVFWFERAQKAPHFIKSGKAAPDFLNSPESNRAMSLVAGNHFWVGHNRAATVGKNCDANSHPFCYEHIVGVHNGTLRGTFKLGGNTKYDVDSMAIFDSLSEHEDPKDTIKNIRGAAALVWYNSKTRELNFWRNQERPLNFIYTKCGNIIFASEAWMATNSAARNGYEVSKVEQFKHDTLLQYNIDTCEWIETSDVKQDKDTVVTYSGDDDGWEYYRNYPQSKYTPTQPPKTNLLYMTPEKVKPYLFTEDGDFMDVLPDHFYKQTYNPSNYIFFCITTDTKLQSGAYRKVIGEFHDENDSSIACVVPEDVVKNTYNNKTMLVGRVTDVKTTHGLREIWVTDVQNTCVIDPLYAMGFNVATGGV